MREENEPSGVPLGSVSGTFRKTDLFARNRPACLEGAPEAWALAMTVIDHGAFSSGNWIPSGPSRACVTRSSKLSFGGF